MKKVYSLILTLLCVILITSGCNYADHSENIKTVTATFNVFGSESENKLTKDELPYTEMNIQPKESATIKGISFNAKLKDDYDKDKVDFLLNVRVHSGDAITAETKEINLKQEFRVELSKNGKEIVINFESPYEFVENSIKEKLPAEISVEFLKADKSKNKDVYFSLDNIKLLTD